MNDFINVFFIIIRMFAWWFASLVTIITALLLIQLVSYQVFNINLYKIIFKRLGLM